MIIVIPMAGLSSRFKQSGYNEPKYMLSLLDKSVFYHAIHSFKAYFNKEKILFVCRDICNTKAFIDGECKKLGLQFYETITLEKETMGQAHTTLLGLEKSETKDTESLLIFNIDTFRPNFSLPITTDFSEIDGYLEVFHAEGNEWSFVLPDKNSNRVLKTSEKDRI
ncbi:MAG: capsular biosynthesis protein, partial [Helicobacter bilis]